jgi:ribosomal protein L37AE/L43A
MELGKKIVIHVSEEAKKEWEKTEDQPKKKAACPSCDIEELKKENK